MSFLASQRNSVVKILPQEFGTCSYNFSILAIILIFSIVKKLIQMTIINNFIVEFIVKNSTIFAMKYTAFGIFS